MLHSFLFMIIFVFSSCASKPKLYPNQKYKSMGKKEVESDVDRCMKEADNYLESSKGQKMAKGAGAGAAIGTAMGAVSGLFTGNLGGGAMRGAAIGAAGGGAAGAVSPDQLRRNYTNHCLADKGYRVIGWD